MTRFTYNDIVQIRPGSNYGIRERKRAWVVGIAEEMGRKGSHYDQFPPGPVYTVEFEDGESIDVVESNLEVFDE